MISVDSNLLLYAVNPNCREFERAAAFMAELRLQRDVVICELALVEFYLVLRSPAFMTFPLSAAKAAEACQAVRRNPRWRLVESAPVMARVWELAARKGMARRRIIDLRLGLTLNHYGVTQFATRNVRDFEGLGFERVWDPLAPAATG